jgi:hypothetical protein
MITVQSTNKKPPLTTSLKEKRKKTKEQYLISKRKPDRIRYRIEICTSNIRKAYKKLSELYEILKNISHTSIKKDEEVNEIYETIQSIGGKLKKIEAKYQKSNIKTQVIEETIEYLKKAARLVDELTQTKEKYKLKNVEEKLQEIKEGTEKTLINFLYIKSDNGSSNEAIQELMDLKEARLQAQREKNVSKQEEKQYVDKVNDIFYAKNSAIEAIKKLTPLCEKLEISLPETLTKISEMDKKLSVKNVKPILELLLENIEKIRKKVEEEMNNKDLGKVELIELRERERKIRMLDERTKKHHSRLDKHELEELEELKGLKEKERAIRVLDERIEKHYFKIYDYTIKSQGEKKSSRTKLFQRSEKLKSYLSYSTKLFKNLEESCKILQKSLSSESEQYKDIQKIKENIVSTKTIIRDKIKYKKNFRKKLYYLEEIIKNIRDMIEKIQGMSKKKKKEEIKLEVARKLLVEMEKHFLEMIIATNEIDGCPLDTEIEKKLAEIDPASKDREGEKERDQLENNDLKEEQSIKIETTSEPKISKKHDIGLEIDFSEASKSSDENSDEDLYDRGPYKKVKKKNFVNPNYIEEDEL